MAVFRLWVQSAWRPEISRTLKDRGGGKKEARQQPRLRIRRSCKFSTSFGHQDQRGYRKREGAEKRREEDRQRLTERVTERGGVRG